jgi:hypothetical protein
MYKLVFLLLLFGFNCSAYLPSDSIHARPRSREEIMKEQIIKLKKGVLLVRLNTKKNSIDALMKNGQTEQAEQLRKKQSNYNKQIIGAFRNNFRFCPFYFFLSDQTENVQAKEFKKVIFLNDSLQPDSSFKLINNNFLIAEFGIISQDTAKYFSNYYYENSKDGPHKKTQYYGGPDLRFEALRILSEQFVQLTDPFPYYVKASGSSTDVRKMNKVVLKMNNKLEQYYKENVR